MLDETAVVTILVAIDGPILGVAFPILLEMISRLDDKYSSEVIISLFGREKSKKFFLPILIINMATFIIWLAKFPPLFRLKIVPIDELISHSAVLFVFASSILLLICFFVMLQKIITFYTPQSLLIYLIKRHEVSFPQNDMSYFLAISDILYFSINKQNEKIALSTSEFMYSAFRGIRQSQTPNEIVYPNDFYNTVSKAIEELAQQKNNKRIKFLAHRTAGGVWLLGEFEHFKISPQTRSYLWNNLLLSLNYEKEDYIMYHWEIAHQYFSTTLGRIQPRYPEVGFVPNNQAEIEERNTERMKFLEFYIALGGVLLYKREYNCIKRMFSYSQSQPPQQYLLTESLIDVFHWYFHFEDPLSRNLPFLSYIYFFPGLEGVSADYTIKYWIEKYISLLFIRQYTVIEYYVYSNSLGVNIPAKQAERQLWLDKLPHFRRLVNEVHSDEALLKSMHLDFVTDDWCHQNKKPTPNEIFDQLEGQVKGAMDQTERDQQPSENKIDAFNSAVANILDDTFQEYSGLRTMVLAENFSKYAIGWVYDIVQKSIFSEDVGVPHLNFESALAEAVSMNFKDSVSRVFAQIASIKYLVNADILFGAFDKLNVNSREFTIVSFSNDPKLKRPNGKSLTDHLPFANHLYFPYSDFQLVGNSYFIVKNADLPCLIFNEPTTEEVKKYELTKISQTFSLYTSVIDLNLNGEIRDQYGKSFQKGDDIRKFVFVMIYMNIELRIREKIKVVQIEEASIFKDSRIPDNLSDIQAFK